MRGAATAFAALEGAYPRSVEVAFYLGVSRLFLSDYAGAITALQAARRVDDGSFGANIGWYLAVAEERVGRQGRRERRTRDDLPRDERPRTARVPGRRVARTRVGMRCAIACAVFVAAALLRGAALQVQPPPIQAESFQVLSDEAQRAFKGQSWDAAAGTYQAIVDLARRRHEELWEARGLLGLGSVSAARARYEEARRLVLESLGTFERLRRVAGRRRAPR